MNFSPNNLGQLFEFSKKIMQRSTQSLIVCIAPTHRNITTAALLLGSHLIVRERLDLSVVSEVFSRLSAQFIPFSETHGDDREALTVFDCWAAVYRATKEGWLDFSDEPRPGTIDMQEYIHYNCTANGELHVVVPDKLLAFPCPFDLPKDLVWMDEGGSRRFSAAYYADIFTDFDVSVAVCCARADEDVPYKPAALAQHGAAVEALLADARSGGLLASVDRLLTLARAAPGAIALHGLGAWEEGLLVSAYLIRLHGFPAREALAWARMAHPPGPAAAPAFELHAAAAPSAGDGSGVPVAAE